MRILIHIPWDVNEESVGGTENFALNICSEFRKFGYDAFIVCSSLEKFKTIRKIPIFGRIPKEYEACALKSGINEHFYKHHVLKGNIKNYKKFCRYVEMQLTGFNYDYIILNSLVYSLIDQDKFNPDKTIVVNHENPLEINNYWGKNAYQIFKKLMLVKETHQKLASLRFIFPSKYYTRLFRKKFKIHCDTIPLGVDHNYYSSLPNKAEIKIKYKLNEDDIVFVVPCRLDYKQKGQDIIARAAKQMQMAAAVNG